MRVGYTGNLDHQNARVWIQELEARGVEPVAIAEQEPAWAIEWAPLVITPPRVRGLGLGRLAIARSFAELCASRRIDLLHSHEVRRHAFWARSSGFRPRMVTCWGSDVLRLALKPLGHRLQVRRALSTADAVTVGSQHLLEAAVSAGAQRDACALIGWGVDTDRFRPDPVVRERMRAEWGFSDRIVVLSTRRLHPLYRVGSIIRAVAIARKTEPRLALVIVGDGPEYEGLRHVADEVGLAGSVAFMGGIWSDEWPSMPDVQMGADLCCSVPETDGGPLSVLEAMAAALPIVTTDVPVMREWVADTGAGRLWTGDDEAELAHLILGVLPSASAMGQSGRDYVVRRHRRADEMDRVFALYESLARTRA